MSLIEIKNTEGVTSEPVMLGDIVAVEAGEHIHCQFAFTDLSSIVRVGDDLILTLGVTAPTQFEGFFIPEFSPKPLILHFSDRDFTISEVKRLFDTFFSKVDNEGVEQTIALRSGSALNVVFGNEYICNAQEFAVKDLQRRGDDLYIASAQEPNKTSIILREFFHSPEEGQEAPKLLLQDPASGAANDIMIHPKSAVFQWQGEPLPMATAGSIYAYYFQLTGPDADQILLTAGTDNGTLPAWLSFASLGGGRYLLSGMPTKEAIGQEAISIYAHSTAENLNLHTQQAFVLQVRSREEFWTRGAASDVATAEFRKLGGDFAALGVATDIVNIEAAGYFPTAEIAAVSGLAVLGTTVLANPIRYQGAQEQDITHIVGAAHWQLLQGEHAALAELGLMGRTAAVHNVIPNPQLFIQHTEVPFTASPTSAASTSNSVSMQYLEVTQQPHVQTEATPTSTTTENIELLYNYQPNPGYYTPGEMTMFFHYIAPPTTPAPTTPEQPVGPPPIVTTIDLAGPFNGFTMTGQSSGNYLGTEATTLSDVTGDGLGDLLVAVPGLYSAFLIHGQSNGFPTSFDITSSDIASTVLSGAYTFYRTISGITDINGDHLGDMVIVNENTGGDAYVIFGSPVGYNSTEDLNTLVSSGGGIALTLPTNYVNDTFLYAFDLGDVNGSGLSALALVDNGSKGFGNFETEYVFFGTNSLPTSFNVANLNGLNGFAISSPGLQPSRISMTGIDLNGDGFNDVVVGNVYRGSPYKNQVEVIFGSAGRFPSVINPSTLPVGDGLIIHDSSVNNSFYTGLGFNVVNIGNFNGSGLDDLLITTRSHGAYVLFGNPNLATMSTFDLATLNGTNGFKIVLNDTISSTSYLGDVNGDGIPDILLIEPYADGGKGIAYILFGSKTGFPASIDLQHLAPGQGITIYGASNLATIYSAGGGSDINGDGLADIVISGRYLNGNAGASNVIFGANFTNFITIIGDPNDTLTPITGTNGNDVIYAGRISRTIYTLNGNDFVDPGIGHDIVHFGSGTDTVVYTSFLVNVFGGSGVDTLWFKNDGAYADLRNSTVFQAINIINLVPMRSMVGNTIVLDASTVAVMGKSHTLTVDGNAHSVVYLNPFDNWTPSVGVTYTTYTSSSGAIVNIENGVHVKLAVMMNDNALTSSQGFYILPPTGHIANGGFGEPLAIVHNPLGDGFDNLFIGFPIGGPSYTGITYLVPGSSASHPPSLNIDNPALNAVTITTTTGIFSIDAIGNFTGAGTNELAFVNYVEVSPFVFEPVTYIDLSPISGLSSSQDLSSLLTMAIVPGPSGPFNGSQVVGVGDFSGDGLADIAISSKWVPNVWVIFGSTSFDSSTVLNLSTDLTGSNGFEILNPGASYGVTTLTYANFSGDSFSDIVYYYNNAGVDVVTAVLGKSAALPAAISNSALVTAGEAFHFTDTAHPNSGFGSIMADIGNFHGGLADDFAIAEPSTGTVYVIYGNSLFNSPLSFGSTFDMSSLNGTNGFALIASAGDTITAVGYVGDVNGDGKPDFAVATYNAVTHVGDLFVIFDTTGVLPGTPGQVPLELAAGLIIQHTGPLSNNEIGSITGTDFNGDGLSDIVYSQFINGYTSPTGADYVVFGANFSNHITLQATASNSTINGIGNDVIFAGSFDHVTINAGPGNNFINTGTGHDIINGGTGDNTIVFSALDTAVNAGTGNNTLWFEQDGVLEDFRTTSVFTGIDTIDLQPLLSKQGNTITLSADAVFTLNGGNIVVINGNGMDQVQLQASDGWISSPGPTGYTNYFNSVGPHFVLVEVENTMHPVVFV